MKLTDTIFKPVCLMALPLALAGCLSLSKTYPEKRSFVLDVASEQREPGPAASMVLKISKFRVSPLFVGRAMVYRVGELEYENDFYDEWFIAPGTLLTQQFHAWLSKTGRFRFVLTGTNHIEPTHLLEGSVTEFYGDYRLASAPKAVLGLDLLLVDGGNEADVLVKRTYRQEVPISDRSPDALARGLNEALRIILADFEKELPKIERRTLSR